MTSHSQGVPFCEDDDLLCEFPEIVQDWDDGDQKQPVSPLSSSSIADLQGNQVSLMDTSSSSMSTHQSDVWKMNGFSVEPIPINPHGKINVVKKFDLASSSMPRAILSNLSEVFSFSLPREKPDSTPSLTPIPTQLPSTITFPPPPLKAKGSSSIQRSVSVSSTASASSDDKKTGPERWYDRFEDLKVFVQTHGHCHVPINYTPNLPLSKWTKRQRYQWKLKQDGKPNSMTDDRQQMLEDLGFVWDVRHEIWDTRYRELIQFHRVHGHCNVSVGYAEYPKLGTWVKCQRRQYQLMTTGQKSHMTPVRVQQLNDLGFVWKGKIAARK